jgi:hypothetical protein
MKVKWTVSFHDEFDSEFGALSEAVQDEMLAHARLLEQFGPLLGRPRVDTLKGSRHANMKELRFDADDGVWRVAFAFDPKRKAILLVAGDKSGGSEKRFYRQLIAKADERFDGHLSRLKKERYRSWAPQEGRGPHCCADCRRNDLTGTTAGPQTHSSAHCEGSRHQSGWRFPSGKAQRLLAFHVTEDRRGNGRQPIIDC